MTGATGFLGSEIVRAAVAAGLPVRALSRGSSVGADVRDPESLRGAFDGQDCVIHAAGLAHDRVGSPSEYEDVNVRGTENVLRASAAGGVRRFVLASSVAVYGGSSRQSDEQPPHGPYARSKSEGERRAGELARELGLDLVVLRLATLYGEEDPGNVGRLIRAIDRGRFVLPGPGRNRKSLLHREDAARACLEAVNGAVTGIATYDVVGSVASLSEIVGTIARRLGRRVIRLPIPGPITRALAGIAGGRLRTLLRDDAYDGSPFERELGFRPRVALVEGLNRQVDWYRGLTK